MDTAIVKAAAIEPITSRAQAVMIRDEWIDSKRSELTKAEMAIVALREAGATRWRIGRARERVGFLRKCVKAMERGFVPIPRFDSDELELDMEDLPVMALVALAGAKSSKAFSEIRFVAGRIPNTRPGGRVNQRGRWTHKRVAQRDPLLVGVVRTPSHTLPAPNSWSGPVHVEGYEEHFLIAWWRPEDERDEEMF